MSSNLYRTDQQSVNNFVIIGAGGGLGSALVQILQKTENVNVVGVGRRSREKISQLRGVAETEQSFRYEQIDVSKENCVELLRGLANSLPSGPVNLIYNSAIIGHDIKDGKSFDGIAAREIVEVGVFGFLRTLEAFESTLLQRGGAFLGISSASALGYPFTGPLATYPASKAFMDKMLQGLAASWPDNVRILTIHLGRIGSIRETILGRLFHPSYRITAKHILKILNSYSRSGSYTYPPVHAVVFSLFHHIFVSSWFIRVVRLARDNNVKK